jgi:hypothetical protein
MPPPPTPTLSQSDITQAFRAALTDIDGAGTSIVTLLQGISTGAPGQGQIVPPANQNQTQSNLQSQTIQAQSTTSGLSTVVDKITSGISDAVKSVTKGIDRLKELESTTDKMLAQSRALYDPIQRTYGGVADVDNITNQTALAAQKQMKSSLNTFTSFGDALKDLPEELKTTIPGTTEQINILARVFEDTNEMAQAERDLTMTFYDKYQLRFNEMSQTQTQQASTYAKGMGISMDEVGQLMQRQIQRTGKAGTEILEKVSAFSTQVAAATGVSYKQIVDGVKNIMVNVETFGNVQEDEAARIAGTLQQLGTSYRSFGNMVNKFMSFDTAAAEIGKLTSVFGVHMDAMEMMQLANEDEEAFLHRIRDSFDEQGIAMEDLTKAQRNLVASSLGLEAGEVENFFDSDLLTVGMEDMEKATEEADLGAAFQDMIINADFTRKSLADLQKIADQRIMLPLVDEAKRLDAGFQKVKNIGMDKVMNGIGTASEGAALAFGTLTGVVNGLSDKTAMIEQLKAAGATEIAKELAKKDGDMMEALMKLNATQAVEVIGGLGAAGATRIKKEMAQNMDFDAVTEAAKEAEINVPVSMTLGDLITNDITLLNSEVTRSNQAQEQHVFKIKEQVDNLIDKVMSPILSRLDRNREVNVRTTVEIDKEPLFRALAGYQQDSTGQTFVIDNPGEVD